MFPSPISLSVVVLLVLWVAANARLLSNPRKCGVLSLLTVPAVTVVQQLFLCGIMVDMVLKALKVPCVTLWTSVDRERCYQISN